MTLTKDIARKFLRKLRNPDFYFPKFLKIKNKAGKIIPFQPNKAQQVFIDTVKRLEAAVVPVRIIILKARQFGLSTATEGLIFEKATTKPNQNGLIVAHEDKASQNIFAMSKLFYDKLPDYVTVDGETMKFRPMIANSNEKALVFDNPSKRPEDRSANPGLNSKITIQTAKNLSGGRSSTLQLLHASEVAFWEHGETLMTGLMQAVPNLPETMVVLESTANGVGGYFYDMWKKAEKGENDFVPLFFPWFWHDEYRMPVPDGFELDDDERELKETYDLDDEQLAWRRWCIRNNCQGDTDIFKQEYPSFPEEAFLTTGRPVFDQKVLARWLKRAEEGKHGNLEWIAAPWRADNAVYTPWNVNTSGIAWVDEQKGYLEVWEPPKAGEQYIIGADTAQGLATGDYSAAPVYNARTWKQVAKWHGHIDPDLFAEELATLGYWYNTALIAPEENNHGHALITILKRIYPNIFQRERYDKVNDETTNLLGFRTDPKTKPLIIANLQKAIRDELIESSDKEFISECITYVRGEDGSTDAQQGCHDDLVMASAIAIWVLTNYLADYFDFTTNNAMSHVRSDQKHLPEALREDEKPHDWADL